MMRSRTLAQNTSCSSDVIIRLTDLDDSLLLIESSAFVATQTSKDVSDTTVILLSTGDRAIVKETPEEICQLLSTPSTGQ